MIKELLEYAKKIGFSDLEIAYEKTRQLSLSRRDKKIVKNEISTCGSYSFKGIISGKAVYANSEEDSLDALKNVIDKMLENSKIITIEEPELLYKGDKKYPKVPLRNFDFSKIDISKKINLLSKMEEEALKTKHLFKLVSCNYSESYSKTILANTLNLYLENEMSYAYAYPYMVLNNEGDIVEGYEIKLEYDFKKFDPVKIAQQTSRKQLAKLGATKEINSGTYPCLFDNHTMAVLLSSFSQAFLSNSRYAQKTKFADSLGKQIASPLITIKDDPLYKKAIVNSAFDNEGVACKTKTVVDKGIFKLFLNSLKMSKIYNEKPTGNGSTCSPCNFYIENGKTKVDEAIKDIKYGFVIEELNGLHAGINAISGDFSLQANGKVIVNGKIDKPVRMIVVSGNFFKLLKDVKYVCNDLEFLVDTMNFASPSLLIPNIVVAGAR